MLDITVTVKRGEWGAKPRARYAPQKRGLMEEKMSNRKKVMKLFHVRYVCDFLVPALSAREAFDVADEEMVDMVEGDQYELDDIFNITIENDRFHIVEIVPEDEDVDDDEDIDDEDVDDSADDDEDLDDDEDDDDDVDDEEEADDS